MKSSNSSERQSAPTGAQTSELKQEASRPLGVAACSDSSSPNGVAGVDFLWYSPRPLSDEAWEAKYGNRKPSDPVLGPRHP